MFPSATDFVVLPQDAEEARIVFEAAFHCEICLENALDIFAFFCIAQMMLGGPFPRA